MDQKSASRETFVAIRAINADRQLVYGVVYAPNVLDTYGEMMLPSDVELMAHRYLRNVTLAKSIDTNHDNDPTESYPVESFIARKGDPDYPEGAWVVGVKVDDVTWPSVKSGKINGFSFQCMVRKMPAVVEVESYAQMVGITEEVDGESHYFYVDIDENGRVVSGKTSPGKDGHVHVITDGTITEPSGTHMHRFHLD